MKNITRPCLCLFLFLHLISFGQDQRKFVSFTIPKDLKENANAVVRQNDILVEIKDLDLVIVTQDRIVTVYNEIGMSNVGALEYYSDSRKIRDMQVIVYNALGNKLEKIKEKNFRDVSAVSGGTLYADNRARYLEYTPRSYPITFHYTSQVDYKSTAFLPQWRPLEGFYCSTESSSMKVINSENISLKLKELNFSGYEIEKLSDLEYRASNLTALKNEAYSPDFNTYAPYLKLAMKEFEMEGVPGVNNSWLDFGKWMYTDLISDTQDLPEEVKLEIRQLTDKAKTNIEKARIVYQYVQDRSRYISVQVGIGGWKPINAAKVHNTAYGDCKGLTSYTMALMDQVGVKSHYAAIYGGSTKRNMDNDFSMTEGNHVILYLPELEENEDYWLECTSKNAPFGFLGDFTDDRDALVITPEGGKLVHTTIYPREQNLQTTLGNFIIDKEANLEGSLEMTTQGIKYSWRSDLAYKNLEDLKYSYLQYWDHLNGASIIDATTITDKTAIEFVEKVRLEVKNYGSKSGNLLLFQPNILNRHSIEPPAYEERGFDLEIERGYIDEDRYQIALEDGLAVDAVPGPVNMETKFGAYSLSFTVIDGQTIHVHRRLEIIAGLYDKSDYTDYRKFRSNIVLHDASRAVLKIN
jgi:transglutaminase-like putative cysteine protease